MTVGIYYATTTGKTEDVADRLHNFISSAESPKDCLLYTSDAADE